MADIYVNSEELKLIASGMKNKATIIMDAYQNDIVTALTMGSEALQISGLDTTTVLNSFNKIFTNINTRINTLADFLLTTVTNEYDEVSAAITNEFDNNFANEIAGLLGISVGKVGGNAATTWPKDVELDPGFSYPSKPSTGGNTSTPGTTPGTGTTTPSTPSTNPDTSSRVATPWPDGVNLDPRFSYPNKVNMKDNLGTKFDNIINIGGTGNLSGNRPIYELPVQPKPTPEIMSSNDAK